MGLPHGMHGWTDVAVPDMDTGQGFYTELFGWDAVDGDGDESMPYTMFALDGKVVAGMGPLTPDQAAAGQPPAWSSYIIVDDVDEIHRRAIELGATPLMEPMQILDAGRMVFILDPQGAAIGFWQSGTHDGAEVFNLAGAHSWNDLATRDLEGSRAFYSQLLGWTSDDHDMGEGRTYTMFSNAGRANGGAWDASGTLPDAAPPHWLTWFSVDDCEAAAAKVEELGGSVIRGVQDQGNGPTAIVADPFGAIFAIIQSAQNDGQPPR